eukprot:TRINITY_DN1261_c0_g2_i2.p1 TRINITY_DN1261_c0_g2~~TRINITY_DN1261_c0_g2_i2.p1  ORF type:complete len:185 (+),score=40.63 TRINITY_DN1261_c0_g2_i2:191-745(+)
MQCIYRLCGCCFNQNVTIIAPPAITLDPTLTGKKVALTNRNMDMSGEGVALGGCCLHQDRAYFEIKIVKTDGSFQVGVANRRVDKDKLLGEDPNLSWIFQSHAKLAVGDVIGVAYDQADAPCINFFHNGKLMENERQVGMKGEVYPAISVTGGAEVKVNFTHQFEYPPGNPYQYSGLIQSQQLI